MIRPRSIFKLSFYIFAVLSFSLNAAIPDSDLVGSTQGSFAVGPNGSATYDVPIKLPPNVGGVQPNLSLSYNSSGGNDLLGMGWQLSGLSAISRCPTTLEREGYLDGVDFDDNDQFCLDGQRLVKVGSNEFRTEIDSFNKISGGEYGFTIHTPAGLEMTFGSNDGSRIKLQGESNKVISWALDKVKDNFGNNYSIQYENNGFSTGEYRVKYIYMGNSTSILSRVAFEYETRPDIYSGYNFGSKYQVTQRLKTIKTYAKNVLTKEYVVNYAEAVEPLNTTYTESIEECDASGNCLGKLKFNWVKNNQDEIFDTMSWEGGGSASDKTDFYFYDFDADGIVDYIYHRYNKYNGQFRVRLGNGDGSFGDVVWQGGGSASDKTDFYFNDFDGDGIIDYIYHKYDKYNGQFRVRLGNGDGSFGDVVWQGGGSASSKTDFYFHDYNSDGIIDYIYHKYDNNGGDFKVRLGDGDGSFGGVVWQGGGSASSKTKFHFYDYNGDGIVDYIYHKYDNNSGDFMVHLGKGDGSFGEVVWQGGGSESAKADFYFNDFNGDRIIDYIYHKYDNNGGDFKVRLGKGDGSFSNVVWQDGGSVSDKTDFYFYDYNGDGVIDYIYHKYDNNGGDFKVRLGKGDGSFSGVVWQGGGSESDKADFYFNDYDGNGTVDYIYHKYDNNGGDFKVRLNRSEALQGKINKIIDSYESETVILYEPLTDPSVYQKNTSFVGRNLNANFPASYDSVIQIISPTYVVSQLTKPDGAGDTQITSYKYEGLRYNLYSKLSLGFSGTSVENHKTGIKSITQFRQDYPFIGMTNTSEARLVSSNKILNASQNTLHSFETDEINRIIFPYRSASIETSYMYDNNLALAGSKTIQTSSTFNTNGQVTDSTVTTSGDGHQYTVSTNNTITNSYNLRRKGEITRAEVTSSSSLNTPAITRTSSFDYDWLKGKLIKEVIEPDNSDASIRRVTNYGYDSYGNRISSVTCNGNYVNTCTKNTSGARYSSKGFDTNGLFTTSATNAKGQIAYTAFDAKFGVLKSATDINGLTVSYLYDSLGRKTFTNKPFGYDVTTTRAWCDSYCPTIGGNKAYSKVTNSATNQAASTIYFDQYNREIRKQTEGFDGTLIFIDTEYDDFGRVKRTSEPYFENDTAYWNIPSYDALSRKVSVSSPNQDGTYDTTSRISYEGYITRVTDALNRENIKEKNAIGKVIQKTDKAGYVMSYEYDSLGNLLTTTDPEGNQVMLTYDERGRKKTLNDPDLGNWLYTYNEYDQLKSQTDAKNQRTEMVYDVLGRMTSRTDAAGTSNAKTSTWVYDTALGKGQGKLYQKTAANGDYTRYSFDNTYGQLTSTKQKIGTKTFTTKNSYSYMRDLEFITYPATTAYPTGFQVERKYNSYGYLSEIRRPFSSDVYWKAEEMSARGQIETATLGNGVIDLSLYSKANGWLLANSSFNASTTLREMSYEFDEVGNIESRTDLNQNDLKENFTYDDLDRLTDSWMSGGPSGVTHTAKSYGFDALGNITSKSDVGNYNYIGCGGRPHAVCAAGGKKYFYDDNGSMVSTKIGMAIGTQIGYSAFNKANYMKKGNYAVTFNYDADRKRNYKSRIQSGSLNLQTYYVGVDGLGAKIFEQEVSSATGTKDIHYIYGAGGQAVATHITEDSDRKTEYFHRDHLGSVALVTNDAGTSVDDPVSFDAWGKRRNTNWSDNSTGAVLPNITGSIGFTGQETITEIGLVHMNGRIYDPTLGKFLSADPLIQAPYNSQSYNRYSYVMNNPLSLIDPSGYSWVSKKWKKVRKGVRKVMKAAVRAAVLGPITAAIAYSKPVRNYIKSHKWAQQATSVVAGALDSIGCAGACSTANAAYMADINGLRLEKIMKSAAMAYASYVAFSSVNAQYEDTWSVSRVLANGVTGGAVSKANGGEFADGARLSGLLAAANYIYAKSLKAYSEQFNKFKGGNEARWPPGSNAHSKPDGVSLSDITQNNIGEKVLGDGEVVKSGWGSTMEGSLTFEQVNKVPGMNAFSVVHDVWGAFITRAGNWNKWTNYGSMIPALPITYGAILRQNQHAIYTYNSLEN